ncbi:MAG: hypothetical protein IJ831_10695 [Spirochaetales bacterium]|nr:hypothetical protein [Spirochaetales bacterium]
MSRTIFSDNFKDFSIGPFPFDREHSAMGEYHYFPNQGYQGQWYDIQCYYGWRGPSWLVTSQDGVHYMEQQRVEDEKNPQKGFPQLATGLDLWQNYTLEADLRVLSTEKPCGLLVRYQTGISSYCFWFVDNKVQFARLHKTERLVLAEAEFELDTLAFYHVAITVDGKHLSAAIDGKPVLEAEDELFTWGGIALGGFMPTQYTNIRVTCSDEEYAALTERIEAERKDLEIQRAKHPKMKLWKKISLGNFGAGRQIRFGHLTGTDEMFFIICQHQKRVFKDRYPFISCMTAVSVDTGKVLWQIGEPRDSDDVYEITTDLPFQIYDIDGDGIDEVICAYDYRLRILDGRNGNEKKSCLVPMNTQDPHTLINIEYNIHAMEYLNVDAIRICNVSGNERPSDILIKDRYARLWVYDSNLELLWYFSDYNTGHFPYTYDYNGDGREEVFACYNMIGADGKLLWQFPWKNDHTDEIIYGKYDPDGEQVLAMVAGWEGFIMAKRDGTVLVKDINGHGQRISTGNYQPDRKGMEIVTTTYWGPQQILYMHDCNGNELWHKQMHCNGNTVAPVNWDGDGTELFMTNPSVQMGGLMDGYGRIVVQMPDDGHPTTSTETLDLTGDHRDEIIVWDRHELWIYTQDRPAKEDPRGEYFPYKYPEYNGSNYRGEYSYARWVKKEK